MRGTRARAFASVFLWALGARAQTVAPRAEADVEIRVTGCPRELTDALPAVIKLEIDVLLRERGPTRAPPELVAIRCEQQSGEITVTLEGDTRQTTLPLAELAPDHRARALALAAAELVHSLSNREAATELPAAPTENLPTPAVANPTVPSTSPAPELPRSPARPALFVGGLIEWLGQPKAPLFGARVAFYYPLGRVVVPTLSIDGARGSFRARSARVTAETLSAAAHLHLGTSSGELRWEAGPGARIGWVHLAGHPDASSMLEGRSLTAAWGGPEARARLTYGESQRRSPRLALELGAGLIALPVRGLVDGAERLYALEGPWWSVSAEVGLGL